MLELLLLALADPSPPQRRVEDARIQYERRDRTPIDDAALIAFVRQKFDPMSDRLKWPRTLGMHNGTPVMVYYTCSDVCPNYTKRVVRYNVLPGPACERAGGVAKEIVVPMGIGAGRRRFCIPEVTEPYQQ